MGALMNASMIVSGVNTLLLLILVWTYGRSMVRMPTRFTFGLLAFAGLLLVQNLVTLYYAITMMPLFVAGLEGFLFAYQILQAVAFAALTYSSTR